MISFAPMPRWLDLLKLLFCFRKSTEALTAPWRKVGDEALFFSKTAWALYAIVLWWREVFSNEKPVVWIPAYFCNQALWPIRQLKVNFIFYPIQENFHPDWDACERLAIENPPDIFILTHFYGFTSDVKTTKKFCSKFNALMVEDAAHVLVSRGEVGERGHFVLYSPHKFLPISHGAICIVRPSVNKFVKNLSGKAISLETVRDSVSTSCYPFLGWVLKRVIQKLTRNLPARYKKQTPFELDPPNQPMPKLLCINPWAKKMLAMEIGRIPEYMMHRRACARTWEYILEQKGWSMERVLVQKESVPYMAVFNATRGDAKTLHEYLLAIGCPASSWPDLPSEVKADPTFYAKSTEFRHNMIAFSVNQTLNCFELVRKFGDIKAQTNEFTLEAVSTGIWDKLFALVEKSTLLQDRYYGKARALTIRAQAKLHVLYHNKTPSAMVQIIEKRLLGFITIARINHGPLFLKKDRVTQQNMLYQLKQRYRWYKGRCILLSPALEDSAVSKCMMRQFGYYPFRRFKYRSIVLNLQQTEEQLLHNMRSNWRRALRKSEKYGLEFKESALCDDWAWLLAHYEKFKQNHRFSGISENLLDTLVYGLRESTSTRGHLYKVFYGEEVFSGALVIRHGMTATYLVVCDTSEQTRHFTTSNFLVWNMLKTMKKQGCRWFDLGGIAECGQATANITSFKRGLGGDEYTLVGDYIGC